MTVVLSTLLHYLTPDVESRQLPPCIEKGVARARHGSLFPDTVVTTTFVVFQICDLSDSLPTLVADVLILFPMCYRGAMISSIWHVIDAVLVCLYILLVQLLIYDFSNHMLLMMPLIGLGLMFSARLHVMEKVEVGVGFASITTIGIMFGQNLHPGQNLVPGDLYRITFVTFTLVAMPTIVPLAHRVLNCFTATQFVITERMGVNVGWRLRLIRPTGKCYSQAR